MIALNTMRIVDKDKEIFERLRALQTHPDNKLSFIELVKLLSFQCPNDSDEELLTELRRIQEVNNNAC